LATEGHGIVLGGLGESTGWDAERWCGRHGLRDDVPKSYRAASDPPALNLSAISEVFFAPAPRS
jgi:hypothetical protein